MYNVRRNSGATMPDKQDAYRAVATGVTNLHAAASASPADCPRCTSHWVERIWSMQQYSRDNWFRCDRCGHLFTVKFESDAR